MRVLDLFSGIGGFSLGLERAGMKTVAFCEIDPFCRRVLAKHWPDVPIYDDVRDLTAIRLRRDGVAAPDVICAGFPCQPFSSASAGKRHGKAHDSYLWPELRRVVAELRPARFIGENVTHLDGVALADVVSDLENLDYEVQTLEIPACAVGRDHWRPRLWILGYANGDRESRLPVDAEMAGLPRARDDAAGVGAAHGLPARLDRRRMSALGNAVVPQIPEVIGRALMEAAA